MSEDILPKELRVESFVGGEATVTVTHVRLGLSATATAKSQLRARELAMSALKEQIDAQGTE